MPRSEPFEAAVRAGCNALYPIAKCPFPEGEACQRHCAEEVAFAKAVLTAALPPDPAPETLSSDYPIARQVCIEAAELPDRTSPDEYPDHLLITPEELTTMLLEAFAEVRVETIRALRASLLSGEEPS